MAAKFKPCACCGEWFVVDDMIKVQHGRYRAIYCEDCTYKLLHSLNKEEQRNESEQQKSN